MHCSDRTGTRGYSEIVNCFTISETRALAEREAGRSAGEEAFPYEFDILAAGICWSRITYIMYDYHIPPQKRPNSDDGYFEILSQSVFQAGFSWKVVRQKWPNFRKAFHDFKIERVARMSLRDVARLMRDPGIIRNSAKIMAVIENARIIERLQREQGSLKIFIQSIRKLPYAKRRSILGKTFRWIGPTGAFHFFWCVGEQVPDWVDRNR